MTKSDYYKRLEQEEEVQTVVRQTSHLHEELDSVLSKRHA
jgi:hypothetical protein